MEKNFYDFIEANPVIASVKDDEGLDICCKKEEIKVIFVLYGNICSIKDIVEKIHLANKLAIVHIDLITGLSSKDIVVDFIKMYSGADGIISTKPALVKRAKELGLYTVLRIFVLDSMAFKNIENQVFSGQPDIIEILPGLMPKIITKISKISRIPIIVGGLIDDKNDILEALNAGAIAVSATNPKVWLM